VAHPHGLSCANRTYIDEYALKSLQDRFITIIKDSHVRRQRLSVLYLVVDFQQDTLHGFIMCTFFDYDLLRLRARDIDRVQSQFKCRGFCFVTDSRDEGSCINVRQRFWADDGKHRSYPPKSTSLVESSDNQTCLSKPAVRPTRARTAVTPNWSEIPLSPLEGNLDWRAGPHTRNRAEPLGGSTSSGG
jgi:hypothetical protein